MNNAQFGFGGYSPAFSSVLADERMILNQAMATIALNFVILHSKGEYAGI